MTACVYLVEDDEGVRRALARVLRSSGLEVRAYGDGRSFLEDFRPEGPACLVVDQNLPDLTGLDLQQALGRVGPWHGVVFITGRGDVPTSVQAMKSGAVDFLTKPVEAGELLAAVRQALARSSDAFARRQERLEFERRLALLTPREREVCDGVARGLLNKQIAAVLGTAEKTVKVHRARVMEKLGVDSVAELARRMERTGRSA